MNIEPVADIAEVMALLERNGLPTADLSPASGVRFFGIRDAGPLVAVIGLEAHAPAGLLRSLAVVPESRQRGIGRALVACVEAHALTLGVDTLYLLTTTAETWFHRRGYEAAARDDAPPAIRASAQFAALCPASSAFLKKSLAAPSGPSA